MKNRITEPNTTGTNLHELLGGRSECHKPVVVVSDNLGRVASLPHQFITHTQVIPPAQAL